MQAINNMYNVAFLLQKLKDKKLQKKQQNSSNKHQRKTEHEILIIVSLKKTEMQGTAAKNPRHTSKL